jgi:phosphatidate cytidylyltransferase
VTELQQVATATACALGVGILSLALVSIIPATADHARRLWHLMRTEIFIVATTLAIFLAGAVAMELAVTLIACRVGFECASVWCIARSVPAASRSSVAWTAGLGLATVTAAIAFAPIPLNFIVGLCLLVLLFASIGALTNQPLAWRRILLPVAAFPGVAMLAIALAIREPVCQVALLLAFMLTEIFDSFAVLGGRLFGRHKLFPRLSPQKTVEGLLAGAAALVIAAFLLPVVMAIPPLTAFLYAIATAVAAVVGDLLGSAAKRVAGVKDYPTIMQEQGGLLDILDAWLVAGPILAGIAIVSA